MLLDSGAALNIEYKYWTGTSIKKLSRDYGISHETIRKLLMQIGVQLIARGKRWPWSIKPPNPLCTPELIALCCTDCAKGMTYGAIARKHGICYSTARMACRDGTD